MKLRALMCVLCALASSSQAVAALFATLQGAAPGIYRIDEDGSSTLIRTAPIPGQIDFSSTTGQLYFNELQGGQLWTMSLGGSGLVSLGQFPAHAYAVGIDDATGHIYVGGAAGVPSLMRRPLTSGSFATLPFASLTAYAFESVPSLNRQYIATSGGISYYDTFFGGVNQIYTNPNVSNGNGIALDVATQKLYWTDAIYNTGRSRIMRSNLDGSSVEMYADVERTGGLAIDQATRTMYLAFPELDMIRSYDLTQVDGAENPLTFSTGLDFVWALTFVPVPEPGSAIALLGMLPALMFFNRARLAALRC